MSRWWIIDYRQPEVLQASHKWFGKLRCSALEDRPGHILLFGCDSQGAVDVRKRLGWAGAEIEIHALFKSRLDVFEQVPQHWLQLCLKRLLHKNGATFLDIYPASSAGRIGLRPGRTVFSSPRDADAADSRKPALAFVSPLPPSETGIAVYSEALLAHLGEYYDLTLVVENRLPRLPEVLPGLPWLTADAFRRRAGDFDRIVYQIGNSRYHVWQFDLIKWHPGLVVLHDYYLYDAVWWRDKAGIEPGCLRHRLYEHHGCAAVAALDASDQGRGPENYPVNGDVVNEAAGLVVHSQHALDLHQYWYPAHAGRDVSIIPHLHSLPDTIDRPGARRMLGIDEDTLVIASFGIMNPKKGVDRIVDAFLDAEFDGSRDVRLVFAGPGPSGEFGDAIRRTLGAHPRGNRVSITGYLPADAYSAWLQAADIAVQLRTMTRGETSGAVLDVMAHGLPLITNAHGSNRELPTHAVCMLPEDPAAASLRSAFRALAASPSRRLELGRNAQAWIRRHHDPEKVAALYHRAIEKSLDHPVMHQKQWFDHLGKGAEKRGLTAARLKNVSASMQQLRLLHQESPPRLLIDVSTLARHDLKTGIERVTREMAIQLLKNPPQGYRSELICWRDGDFYLAVDYAAGLLGLAGAPAPDRPAEPGAGDVYLSLEWAPPLLLQAAGVFMEMKALGVRFCFTVHDLLPLYLPHCFPDGTEQKMRAWFNNIAYLADGLLCVSAHVARTVMDQLHQASIQDPPGVEWFHPGADFSVSPGTPMGVAEKRLLKKIDASPRPRLLVVGTLEPRKGHRQVLDAAENLWRRKQPVTLLVAGKEGWGVETLSASLKKHPQRHRRLFWCNAASDFLLAHLYRRADLLVAASLDEGFGLPLIEAAHHRLPILARDTPVFKEVAGDYARYFSARTGTALAEDIAVWIKDWQAGNVQPAFPLSCNSWADSAAQLKTALFKILSPSTRKGEASHEEYRPPGRRLSAGSGRKIL